MKNLLIILLLFPLLVKAQGVTSNGANVTNGSGVINTNFIDRNGALHSAIKLTKNGRYAPDMIDIDGNVYPSVILGTQIWTTKNLVTTHYNTGGVQIPVVEDNVTWSGLTTGARCYYNNDSATYKATYGALYNWFAVDVGTLCPTGWHVPTDAEWTTLTDWLSTNLYGCADPYNGTDIAKSLASVYTDWASSATACAVGNSTPANNASGWTGKPGGRRISDGTFSFVSQTGFWWSTTSGCDVNSASNKPLFYNNATLQDYCNVKTFGYSVRCVKD